MKTHQIVPEEIQGVDIETVKSNKYPNLLIQKKLDCCDHMIYFYKSEPYAFAESTEIVWCVPDFC